MSKIFDLVLEAMYLVAIIEIEEMANDALLSINPDYRAPQLSHRARLREIGEECAYTDHECIPPSLLDNPDFFEPYENMEMLMAWETEEWGRENAELEAKQARIARTKAIIAAEQWSDLGYPSPAELCAVLLGHEPYRLDGYFLIWEEGHVWYTNPYGCDGILCKKPTEDEMREFLTNIALGEDYGQIPW